MAARKEASELVKSARVRGSSKAEKRNNAESNNDDDVNERRNDQRYLLLSTTYGLNSSHSKKLHVGLRARNDEDDSFEPVVKLIGNYVDGICFDVDTWQQFQANTETVILYLTNENQKDKLSPIIINNISISFTTAYGAKAVLIAYKENSNQSASDEEEVQETPTKKRRTYSAAIVMQKTTFLGLENIVKCVNARLTELTSVAATVKVCEKLLINEVDLKLPSYIDPAYFNHEIIKLTIKTSYREIEQALQKQINDLTFLDVYFHIVFEELLALRFNYIVRIILLKRKP